MKKKIIAAALSTAMLATVAISGTLAYFNDTTKVVENTFTMGKVDIELDEAKVEEKDGEITPTDERTQENDYETIMVPGRVFPKDPTIHVIEGSEESYIFLDMTFNKFSSLFWVMAADATEDKETEALKGFAVYETTTDNDGNVIKALDSKYANDKGVFSTTKFVKAMMDKDNKAVFQAMIEKWFTGIEHEKWELCDILIDDDGKYMTIRFAYKGDTDGNVYTFKPKADNDDDIVDSDDIIFMKSFQMPASVTQEMISDGQKPNVGGMVNAFNTDAADFHLNFKAYAIQADTFKDEIDETTGEVITPAYQLAYNAMFDTDFGANLTNYQTNP